MSAFSVDYFALLCYAVIQSRHGVATIQKDSTVDYRLITPEEEVQVRAQLKEGLTQAAIVAQSRGYTQDPRITEARSSRDNLGDRMKRYEATESDPRLLPNMPVYVRLDGRAFSTFTRGLPRPYDRKLSWIMAEVTKTLQGRTKAAIAYTQSDEISLGWFGVEDANTFMFGGRIQKMTTVLAGLASARFNQLCIQMGGIYADRAMDLCPHFDARIYQVPNNMELMNSFVWREQDCQRNSVSMAAQAQFSHKALQKKDSVAMKEMLEEIGKPYEDMPEFFRRGSYFKRFLVELPLPDDVPAEFRIAGETMLRSRIMRIKNHPWQTTAERLQFFE